jgi:radical SAM protein (TIGR01212 family)
MVSEIKKSGRSIGERMMEYPWKHTQRYNSYPEYFKKIFGKRVQKVALDAGFTCPNRDGTSGIGGCTFCDNDAFNPSYCDARKSISQQISEGIEFHRTRYRRAKQFLAYFQAFSNTYAPLEKLKTLYEEALSFEGIIGLVVGTRPDCVDEKKLDYLAALAEKYYIKIEYGLESIRDSTLLSINRGHNFDTSLRAIRMTHERGIPVGAHFIIGLQGESQTSFIHDIETISMLRLESIKFHQLQIIRGTRMEKEYQKNPSHFETYSLDEYLALMVEVVEKLNPAFVIERIAAEVPPRFLVSHGWGLIRYDEVLRKFEKQLELCDTWQGRLYKSE